MRALAVAVVSILVLGASAIAQDVPASGPWCVRVELRPGASPTLADPAALERAIVDGAARVTEVGACTGPADDPAAPSSGHGQTLAMSELSHPGTLGLDLRTFQSRWNRSSKAPESLQLGPAFTRDDVFSFPVGTIDQGILLGGRTDAHGEISAIAISWSPDEAGASEPMLALRNYAAALMMTALADVLTPGPATETILTDLDHPMSEPWGEREHQLTTGGVTYTLVSFPDDEAGGTTVWMTARAADTP